MGNKQGMVIDRNLTLGDLIGTIKTFFQKIDIEDVRFKPAYNPYTEVLCVVKCNSE